MNRCVKRAVAYVIENNFYKSNKCDTYFRKNDTAHIDRTSECELTLVNDVITTHMRTTLDNNYIDDIESALDNTDLLNIEVDTEPTNIPRFDLLTNSPNEHLNETTFNTPTTSSIRRQCIPDVANTSSNSDLSSESESTINSDLDLDEFIDDCEQSFLEENISNNKNNVITSREEEVSTSESPDTTIQELDNDSSQESRSPVKEILKYKVLYQRLARGEPELTLDPEATPTYEMTPEEIEKRNRRMKLNRQSSKRARRKRKERERSIKEVLALRRKEYCELKTTHDSLKQQRDALQLLFDQHKLCKLKPP